jgi:hypothetical protein
VYYTSQETIAAVLMCSFGDLKFYSSRAFLEDVDDDDEETPPPP